MKNPRKATDRANTYSMYNSRDVGKKFEPMRPNKPHPLAHPQIVIARYCTQITVVTMFRSLYQQLIANELAKLLPLVQRQ